MKTTSYNKIKEEIKELRNKFKSDAHYYEVDESAGWHEEFARLYDAGMIYGLEKAMQIIKENETK